MNDNIENQTKEQSTQDDNTLSKERVFTQDDVNRIVSERLTKERDKLSQEYALKNAELERRKLDIEIEKELKDNNIPLGLMEILKGDDIHTAKNKISIFKDELNRLVDIEIAKRLKERLKGSTPKQSNDISSGDYDIRQAFGLD